jgi:2-hydroxychromene-2-carboxylate isomerase
VSGGRRGPIDFYFDFASPYGFLAAMQIEAVAERAGRRVAWRPFLLGAVDKAVGQSPLEHPLKRAYVIGVDVPRLAHAAGLAIKAPADFPSHAMPATRLFYWLDDRDAALAVRFAVAAYRAYWLDGCGTADATVAINVAASVGIVGAEADLALGQPAVKQRLVDENEKAIRRGVFGSPFMIVDGEPFWGGDRLTQVERRARETASVSELDRRE